MTQRPTVLVGPQQQGASGRLDGGAAARMVGVAGFALGLAGWIDVLLLWYPLRFGNAEWEFATATSTFDALPLATLGFVLLAGWALARRARRALLTLGTAAGVIALALVAVGVLFALGWIQGMGVIASDSRWLLIRGGAKTSVYAVIYVVLYGWSSTYLLGSARRGRSGE